MTISKPMLAESMCDIDIVKLCPKLVNSAGELAKFEKECLEKGFEGVIVRSPDSPYKCGRSTLKQQWMLKVKQFVDDEAEVVGFEELLHNNNESSVDERGYLKRSSTKYVKYKYFPIGTKDAPRHPVKTTVFRL
ncbi:hypothetical protein BCR44DRAFT_1465456 [Catenaria anguillulae PL171]|uniref:ATP-dependent DNA ligase family profile domain-containing protein n=1 Tax=Catenaria anguillulae PL171 TaxID=765915 RepID=A0A1Y2HA78_9FUNG|nr:hypothetical protein BCR44DRAFT_1465456 [Catenaria anguillulae PL171]